MVRALDSAVETFEGWGVRIPGQAALFAARQWLAHLGVRDNISLTVDESAKTSEPSLLAVDL